MNKWIHRAKTLFWSSVWKIKRFRTVDDLVAAHFDRWSQPDHQNRRGLFLALDSQEERQLSSRLERLRTEPTPPDFSIRM